MLNVFSSFNSTHRQKSKLFLLPCCGNVIPINLILRILCAVSDTCFAEKNFQHQRTLLKCLTFFQQTFIEKKMTFQHDTCQLQVPLKINEKIYRIQQKQYYCEWSRQQFTKCEFSTVVSATKSTTLRPPVSTLSESPGGWSGGRTQDIRHSTDSQL